MGFELEYPRTCGKGEKWERKEKEREQSVLKCGEREREKL